MMENTPKTNVVIVYSSPKTKNGGRGRATRGSKPSPLQKEMVAKLMEGHPDLARGRLAGPNHTQRAAVLWRAATDKLNASGYGGCVKSWTEWRKYWTDKKVYLKGYAARRLIDPTGGARLDEWNERMLKVLGDDFGQSVADNVSLSTPGAEVAKEIVTFSPTEPPPLHDIKGSKATQIRTASIGSEEEEEENQSHVDASDPLLQEDEEKWEWYDEEVLENEEEVIKNEEEEVIECEVEEENTEIKLTGLQNEPCIDLREAKSSSKKSRAMVQPADTRINRELINQSNQSFGMFIANELQQYEPVERYEIMKNIIDIFIKR